jgi:hypothetical protein
MSQRQLRSSQIQVITGSGCAHGHHLAQAVAAWKLRGHLAPPLCLVVSQLGGLPLGAVPILAQVRAGLHGGKPGRLLLLYARREQLHAHGIRARQRAACDATTKAVLRPET